MLSHPTKQREQEHIFDDIDAPEDLALGCFSAEEVMGLLHEGGVTRKLSSLG